MLFPHQHRGRASLCRGQAIRKMTGHQSIGAVKCISLVKSAMALYGYGIMRMDEDIVDT